MSKRSLLIGSAALLAVIVIVWFQVGKVIGFIEDRVTGGGPETTQVITTKIGGPFSLTAHTGERVTDQTYRGKYMLIYFGYTFCPDVCPTELTIIADALDLMGKEADRIQPLLITVDPERDTPEALASYVAAFHPQLVGLTGSAEEIAAAAKAYRAYYAKSGEGEDYLMDHSSVTYLMGPDGTFLTTFSYGTPAERVAQGLVKFISR